MREIELKQPEGIDLAELGKPFLASIDTDLSQFSIEKPLAEFQARFPEAMELLKICGVHPTEEISLINPYTGKEATESYANIGEHCIAVAYAASQMMKPLIEAGIIQHDDADYIVERALLHDATKAFETMRKQAKKAGLAEEVYTVSAYEQLEPLLVQMGVSEDRASYLAHAGSETGHNSLRDFIAFDDSGMTGIVPGKIAEKIVHLADDLTFTSTPLSEDEEPKTFFLTPWERMLASRFIEKYAFLWEEGLGTNSEGELVTVRDIENPEQGISVIANYTALQVEVAHAICREFQLYIDPPNKQSPEQFIKNLINSGIR